MTIVSINGTTIGLSDNLAYLHYGAPQKSFVRLGEIDMRAPVGHITRNIRFTCDEVDNWGGRVLITKFFDYANFLLHSGTT